MNWSILKNRRIKNIYYLDELGGVGIHEDSKQFHFIQYGNIFLTLEDRSIFEIAYDDYKGISLFENDDFDFQKFEKNNIEKDKYWNTISNKTINEVVIYNDKLILQQGNKKESIEVISTIEIVFINGERIFISNAGYIEEEKIISMTDDFIIYRKRRIGQKLNLLK